MVREELRPVSSLFFGPNTRRRALRAVDKNLIDAGRNGTREARPKVRQNLGSLRSHVDITGQNQRASGRGCPLRPVKGSRELGVAHARVRRVRAVEIRDRDSDLVSEPTFDPLCDTWLRANG